MGVKTEPCGRCGSDPAVEAGVCGFCLGELREAAVDALFRPAPDSTFAIWFLRDQGYSAPGVVGAVKAAGRGYSRAVVEGLLERSAT